MKSANRYPNLRAAIYHWLGEQASENNTRGTEISEIDIKLPDGEITGTQGGKKEEVENGEYPQGPNANDHPVINAESGAPETKLKSENAALHASLLDLEQRCAKYESELDSLITEHKAHRCMNGDELDILDNELEESFIELNARILALFEQCDASRIDLDTIQEMNRACLANTQPSWWNVVLDERKRIFWLRGLLANALHEEFFDKRFFFDVDGKGEIKAGLTNFEKILVQENSGGTSPLLFCFTSIFFFFFEMRLNLYSS
jgi:hypothetical protein